MKSPKIQEAASALGNQLSAGIPLFDAVRRMARLQPEASEFWIKSSASIASGKRLSDLIAGVWPPIFSSAIKAGEESGTLPQVFQEIDKSIAIQSQVRGMVMRLMYPFLMGLTGLAVFIFFMLYVFPSLTAALGEGDKGFVFSLSENLVSILKNYWMYVMGGLMASILLAFSALKEQSNLDYLFDLLIKLPVIGSALTSLYFSSWASYMALMDKAGGIDIQTRLTYSADVMPGAMLKSGIYLMRNEVIKRGLADAADAENKAAGDPRKDWPFYIGNAFIIAQQTGRLDVELTKISPILLKEGVAKLESFLKIANIIALALSAAMIVGPLLAYYIELGSKLRHAMA